MGGSEDLHNRQQPTVSGYGDADLQESGLQNRVIAIQPPYTKFSYSSPRNFLAPAPAGYEAAKNTTSRINTRSQSLHEV